jgi:hypothetical protein
MENQRVEGGAKVKVILRGDTCAGRNAANLVLKDPEFSVKGGSTHSCAIPLCCAASM